MDCSHWCGGQPAVYTIFEGTRTSEIKRLAVARAISGIHINEWRAAVTGTPDLQTSRLELHALRLADVPDMVGVLADTELYSFTGGEPPDGDELEARYRAQLAGPGAANEAWHNWIIRLDGAAVGFVQASVIDRHADVAWLVGLPWQRRGIATESARAMCEWLLSSEVETLAAHVHPDHVASQRVAASVGLRPSGRVDDEGEMIWTSPQLSNGDNTEANA